MFYVIYIIKNKSKFIKNFKLMISFSNVYPKCLFNNFEHKFR